MLILDTNVISELMRDQPNPDVVAWIDSQPSDSIWTTTVSVFEICTGIELLPDGKRAQTLREGFEKCLTQIFDRRVLYFDVTAARIAAVLAKQRYQAGLAYEIRDIQIAGIVSARNGSLATRNVKDFQQMNLPLINPWGSQAT
tara:strand:+ start:716 stop:1144 length:429 start_codon:yes stop_codon:yes gene_type:complete